MPGSQVQHRTERSPDNPSAMIGGRPGTSISTPECRVARSRKRHTAVQAGKDYAVAFRVVIQVVNRAAGQLHSSPGLDRAHVPGNRSERFRQMIGCPCHFLPAVDTGRLACRDQEVTAFKVELQAGIALWDSSQAQPANPACQPERTDHGWRSRLLAASWRIRSRDSSIVSVPGSRPI